MIDDRNVNEWASISGVQLSPSDAEAVAALLENQRSLILSIDQLQVSDLVLNSEETWDADADGQ